MMCGAHQEKPTITVYKKQPPTCSQVGGCRMCIRLFYDFIDNSVLQCVLRGHVEVPIAVFFYLCERLPGVFGEDLIEALLYLNNMLRLDFDVACLSLRTADDLVDHYFGVGERITLAFRAAGKEKGSHRSPKQMVETGALTWWIVSRIASPSVTMPPGVFK